MFPAEDVERNETLNAQNTFSVSLPGFKTFEREGTRHGRQAVCSFFTFSDLFTFIVTVLCYTLFRMQLAAE